MSNRRGFSELFHYPTAVVGLVIITSLLALAAYTLISIPYDKAISMWRGDEATWDNNPKNAGPVWLNYITNQKLPETIVVDTAQCTGKKTRTLMDGLTLVSISLPLDYQYDDYPTEMTLFLNSTYETEKPFMAPYWVTPDGRQIELEGRSVGTEERYYISLDNDLIAKLGGQAPEVGLFSTEVLADLSQSALAPIDDGSGLLVDTSATDDLASTDTLLSDTTVDSTTDTSTDTTAVDTTAVDTTVDSVASDVVAADATTDVTAADAPAGTVTQASTGLSAPIKGKYSLNIDVFLFDEKADIDAKLVVYGKVHGLAGTDHRRRDMLVALLWGTPIALAFGLLAALGSTVVTFIIAAFSVWYGRWVDALIQRITEVNMILPMLPILIMVGTFYSRSIWVMLGMVVLLGIFGGSIKTFRAMFLQVKQAPYIEAAKAYGAGNMRIIFRYLIPRMIPVLIPSFVTLIPSFVFLEASLAVLGLGDPVLPTWGKLLQDAFSEGAAFKGYYYWILQPSILLMLTGLGFSMVGFALDRIYNPRLRGR